MKSLTLPSTTRLAFIVLGLALSGWLLDAIPGPTWSQWGVHSRGMEIFSTGLFNLCYGALWILLPVAAFRPLDRFYMKGDCLLRLRKFGLVFGILVLIHALIIAHFAYLFRGGFVGGA